MRVAILTNFRSATSGYSLVHCVEQQVLGAEACGLRPVVIVQEGFQEDAPGGLWTMQRLDLRPVIPGVRQDESHLAADVQRIVDALAPALADVDAVLTHDVFFLGGLVKHALACRRIAEQRPALAWLNWAHSSPHRTPPAEASAAERTARFSPPPGRIVCMNSAQRYGFAQQYELPLDRVVTIRHGMHPLGHASPTARALFDGADFATADVAVVFPAAHYRSKQHGRIVRLCAAMQAHGVRVRFLWLDWSCAAAEHRAYQRELHKLARKLGWDGLRIASELHPDCRHGVTRRDALDLLHAADVVIQPSTAESYSLVAHEALLAGCLLVVDQAMPLMVELYGAHTVNLPFGELGDRPGGDARPTEAWSAAAMEVLQHLKHNPVLRARSTARTQWNHVTAWRAIEPLLRPLPASGDDDCGCAGRAERPREGAGNGRARARAATSRSAERPRDGAGRDGPELAAARRRVCESSGPGGSPCAELRVIGGTQWCATPIVGGWREWLRWAPWLGQRLRRRGCGCNLDAKRKLAGARCPLGRW